MEREPASLRRYLVALLIALVSLLLTGCSGVSYLVENGVSQWKIFNRARPIEEVLANPRVSEDVKRDIRVVIKAKKFAGELGLKATSSYGKFVQLDAPCVIWAVSAADPVELKERKWSFPIVGAVPYLGFFYKDSAEAEALRLGGEKEKPDTWIRCVPAFSSLGWFPDPLYSSMLKGQERDIAELVIHESFHATVWVKGSVDFNEKLANFVGLEGSLRYVERFLGPAALEEARRVVRGEKIFGDFMKAAEAAYKESVKDRAAKEAFYRGLADRYRAFLSARKEKFVPIDAKLFKDWNNAAFLAYLNYYSDTSVFEAMLKKCEGNLNRFVRWIAFEAEKDAGRFESAPEEHLGNVVKESSCVE